MPEEELIEGLKAVLAEAEIAIQQYCRGLRTVESTIENVLIVLGTAQNILSKLS